MSERTQLEDCSPSVRAVYARLGNELNRLGLQPSPVLGGCSFKFGGRTIIRIDFKHTFLRVFVGDEGELQAPHAQRLLDLNS
jgi:hypothetical protein